MKKNILFSMFLALVALAVTSCGDKDSEGLSRITYYPTIELEGDSYLVWDKGTAYEEPGYTSMMGNDDVTDQVVVTGRVDTNTSGIYTLTYTTAKNEDGFGASATRTVVVLDPNSTIEGFWLTTPDSYREYNGEVAYGRSYEILVIDNGDGTYTVDDLLGGWYCQRAGYGSAYAMEGIISIDDDGTIGLVDSYVPGWGDWAEDLEGTYDAETNTLYWAVTYTDYPFIFHVTLNKE